MHFKKIKTVGITNMLRHYTREHIQEDGHIDTSRTHLNKIYSNQGVEKKSASMKAYIDKQIETRIKRKVRPDAVKMVDLIITLPKQIQGEENEKKFFDKMMAFCCIEFGTNNIISYVIHKDEATPHVHCSFIPIMKNEKGEEILSAKKILTRSYLKEFHKKAEEKTGYKCLLVPEDDRKKNLTLQQFKAMKEAQDRLNEIEEQIEEKKTLYKTLEMKYNESEKELTILTDSLNIKENKIKEILERGNNQRVNISTPVKKMQPEAIREVSEGKKIEPPKKTTIDLLNDIKKIDPRNVQDRIKNLSNIYFINTKMKYEFDKVINEKQPIKKMYALDFFIDEAIKRYRQLSLIQEPKKIIKNQLTR